MFVGDGGFYLDNLCACFCVILLVLIVLNIGSSNAQYIISNFGIMFRMCEIHMQLATFLLLANFRQNPYLKNMISTYRQDFPWKKSPKFARFEIYIFYQSPDFYYEFPVVGSQKYLKRF